MRHLILICFFIMGASELKADQYLDIGIGVHSGEYDSFSQYSKKYRTVKKIAPFIGTIEYGYKFDNASIFFRHDSSITQNDTGLNLIGIKLNIF